VVGVVGVEAEGGVEGECCGVVVLDLEVEGLGA
jgi:hypothetical protein